MLFGRSPPKEKVHLPELEAYLNSCFDVKLKRLSARLPEIEANLKNSRLSFEKSIHEFSKSAAEPDMEHLYGLKDSYLKSQKANYASSLLRLLSPPPQYGGSYLYLKAKSVQESYLSFITGVMKVNATFRLAMIAYAAELASTKKNFTAMEHLCKELGNELSLCLPEENEYRKISTRVSALVSEHSELYSPAKVADHNLGAAFSEERIGHMKKKMEEKQKEAENARHRHHEADSALAGLLLPIERAARKHDHLSHAKTNLGDYARMPTERIRSQEDIVVINRHLELMETEVSEGKIDEKNLAALLTQIKHVRSSNLLAHSDAARATATELKNAELGVSEVRAELQALEKAKMERQRMAEEKDRTEREKGLKEQRLLSEKEAIEKLFLDCYKKQIEIVLPKEGG